MRCAELREPQVGAGTALEALGGRFASVGAATDHRADGGGGGGTPWPPGTFPAGCQVKLP